MKMFGSYVSLLAAVVLLLFAAAPAQAQFNASLSGTVMDPTQAVIPGAIVTLTNEATQVTQTQTSGAAGTYQFNQLPPGNYTLATTAKGFQQNTTATSRWSPRVRAC